ncbi:MAG: ferrous iron transporter B, partial [Clostridia bacterium]|nr:ferrous iron transporter B [Clostridia bacterium]
ERLIPTVSRICGEAMPNVSPRWIALRLLEQAQAGSSILPATDDPALTDKLTQCKASLAAAELGGSALTDAIVAALTQRAEQIRLAVCPPSAEQTHGYSPTDRRLDRLLTGRITAFPLMLLLLIGIFWLTIEGANYPSVLLERLLSAPEPYLAAAGIRIGLPPLLIDALVYGVYRTLVRVVSVMLPPMAIFFPLFTLLEDAGYLPRIAYNLDRPFRACRACGKQALCMCMGFGCNAAGVVGCRIIDSPRERLLAILTNNLVPCNGRFPTLIALITLFFVGTTGGVIASMQAALWLTALILLSVLATFALTRILSVTLLRGMPSSFTLELPSYRRPQIGRIIVRSIFDRTLFVLGRAAAVAAPAGLLIWLLANLTVDGASLLTHAAALLDPLGRLMGMDGVILLGFILGFPANEIVLPIITMTYTAGSSLSDSASLSGLHAILTANGWTSTTALCVMIFSLFHWPCSTTLWTIRRETGSVGWTILAALLPTMLGALLCMLIHLLSGIL